MIKTAGKFKYIYTVYDAATGRKLAEGTSGQCADALDMTPKSMRDLIQRESAGRSKKYRIEKSEFEQWPKLDKLLNSEDDWPVKGGHTKVKDIEHFKRRLKVGDKVPVTEYKESIHSLHIRKGIITDAAVLKKYPHFCLTDKGTALYTDIYNRIKRREFEE